MSDSPIESFLVEIGVKSDKASAAAAEAMVRKTEGRLTDITSTETDKRAAIEQKNQTQSASRLDRWLASRTAAEKKANDEKIAAVTKVFGSIMGLDEAQSKEWVKRIKASAAQSVDVEKDRAKKAQVVRSEQFKDLEAGLMRFSGVAEKITLGVGGLLSALPFGSLLMNVQRTAAGLSDMAIQSQRVGSSVAGIQRFSYAMKRMGVSEGESSGALEGFAARLKTNPEGYRSVLAGMGVKTTGSNGKPLGYDELLENFGDHLAAIPYNQARIQFEQMGGSGDNALNALRNPGELRKGLAAYDDKLKGFGLDPDKAAEDARKVQQAYDNLEADLKIIHQKLDSEFFVPMMNGFDALAKKIEENPQLVENYGRALEGLATLAAARIVPTLANLAVRFSGLQSILGTSLGTAAGIALNPVVIAGAMAESTPGAGVPADPAERAKVAAENQRLTDEANKRQGSTGSVWQDSWNYIKGKLGFGDDPKIKADISTTAEATQKLADAADRASTEAGGGGGGALGAASRVLGWAGRAMGGGAGRGDGAPLHFAGFGNGGWEKSGASKEEVANYIRRVAAQNGIDPDTAVRVARSEGLGTYTGDYGTSFGPFQLHYGGSGIRGMNSGGLGDRFTKETGLDARDPKTWKQQVEYALRTAKREGWGAWHGAAHVGIGNRQGMDYHGPIPPDPTAAAPTAPVGDQAALNAQKRIVEGKGTPADHATIAAHRAQQNAPQRGRPFGVSTTMGADGQPMTTIDRRDPRFAPHPALHPDDDRASRARSSDVGHGAGWRLSPLQAFHGGGNDPLSALHRDGWLGKPLPVEVAKPLPGMAALHATQQKMAEAIRDGRLALPKLSGHALVSGHVAASINASRHHHFERHGDTFHVHGGDTRTGLDDAHRLSARREGQDRIRYMQGSQQ